MNDPRAFVRERFGAGAVVEPLLGDASDRCYLRVRPAGGSPLVVMAMREPFDPPYVPFERMAAFFDEHGFPVPRVLERHPASRALILEDLGDESLQARLARAGGEEPRGLYEEAVDWIVRLQRRGTPAVAPDVPAYHFCLDDVKLGRELDYFREHYLRGLLGDPLSAADADLLDRSLDRIAREAGRSGDRVLCHRDFHSRNLMLPPGGNRRGGRLAMIDFQDARLGPRGYDLASLLCDAYVEVPADLAAAMRERFLRGVGLADRADELGVHYAWVAAQRSLKAAGTFAGQKTRFGVDRYLRYLPRALACARQALRGIEEMAGLADLLAGPLRWPQGGPPGGS